MNLNFFYFKDQLLELLTKSNTFNANCSTRIEYMYIYSYTVSINVKQQCKSKVYFLINKQ